MNLCVCPFYFLDFWLCWCFMHYARCMLLRLFLSTWHKCLQSYGQRRVEKIGGTIGRVIYWWLRNIILMELWYCSQCILKSIGTIQAIVWITSWRCRYRNVRKNSSQGFLWCFISMQHTFRYKIQTSSMSIFCRERKFRVLLGEVPRKTDSNKWRRAMRKRVSRNLDCSHIAYLTKTVINSSIGCRYNRAGINFTKRGDVCIPCCRS